MKAITTKQAITANLRYGMALYCITPQELAAAMIMSERTLRVRMSKPGKFSIDELSAAAALLHTTLTDIITIRNNNAR